MQDLLKHAEPYLKMRNDFIHTRVAHGYALLLLEKEGAIIAEEILTEQGYDAATIQKIVQIIERHDSGKNPETTEEKLVKDADRHTFLCKKMDSWFFTRTAKALAEKELQARDKESYKGFL